MRALLLSSMALLAFAGNERVLLSDVATLTLHAGRQTTGRRNSPIPQLTCVGGSAIFTPHIVQCYNRGFDGSDYQWECKADMPSEFRFGAIEVVCEGFDYPDDPYILKGSCGLEYKLEHAAGGQKNEWNSPMMHKSKPSMLTNIAVLFTVAVVIYIIYQTCIAPNSGPGGAGRPGGGAGGGGFDNGPRPPPPGFQPPPYEEKDRYSSAPPPSYSESTRSTGGGLFGGGGPGFWTGLGAGGLFGYLMSGNRGTGYTGRTGYGGYNSGPFGAGPSTSYGGGPSTSAGSSTHTSSGFGGTRRR